MINKKISLLIKGAGEMATGIACRLYMANLKNIIMTEILEPLTVRRTVAFSEAIYEKEWEVEGVRACLATKVDEIEKIWKEDKIAVIVDPEWKIAEKLKPYVVIDAIMAKRNIGTKKGEASLVIGVGPGFSAPEDVHAVVESNRGHDLGRVFYNGKAEAHTGVPAAVMGYTTERILRSPHEGFIRHVKKIGDTVKKGETIVFVNNTAVHAQFDGLLRGVIREIHVSENEKIGDVDPLAKIEQCFSITEKARAIGGGVLEAIMHIYPV